MSKNKAIIIGLIVIVLFIAWFLIYQKPFNKNLSFNTSSRAVPCLTPDIPLIQHIHPHLTIIVDGKNQIIPSDIGITSSCEKALHTHDDSGLIHIEAQDNRQYTLGDFFDVWEKAFPSDAKMTVNDKQNNEFRNLVLQDGQEIIIEYQTSAMK